jgi:hypothetical protein
MHTPVDPRVWKRLLKEKRLLLVLPKNERTLLDMEHYTSHDFHASILQSSTERPTTKKNSV